MEPLAAARETWAEPGPHSCGGPAFVDDLPVMPGAEADGVQMAAPLVTRQQVMDLGAIRRQSALVAADAGAVLDCSHARSFGFGRVTGGVLHAATLTSSGSTVSAISSAIRSTSDIGV